MPYRNEMQLYPEVGSWLKAFLESRFRRATIEVYDTHAAPLNNYIRRKGLERYFSSSIWQAYDIRVDITGFVFEKGQADLVFVECKMAPISLMHFSQLLGYSRVAHPLASFLVSPSGIGDTLLSLVQSYGRADILEYSWQRGRHPRRIIIARWDESAKALDQHTIIPAGAISDIRTSS